MEKEFIRWPTKNGFYKLYKNGRIEKPNGYISDGKTWEFVGLVERKAYGRLGNLIKREDCFNIPDAEMKYKNGKNRYRVVDNDHGTLRIWY